MSREILHRILKQVRVALMNCVTFKLSNFLERFVGMILM
jgi:hypothetical protein